MAGADYILDKTYKTEPSGGIGKFLVVVHGTNAEEAALPAAANAANVLGVTQEKTTAVGQHIRVRKLGISRVTAAGAISRGDFVNVADALGKVKSVNEVGGTNVFIVGQAEEAAATDGDIIKVHLNIHRSQT